MALGVAYRAEITYLKRLLVWVKNFEIWLSIPRTVYQWVRDGCGCGELRCVTASPYIDLVLET